MKNVKTLMRCIASFAVIGSLLFASCTADSSDGSNKSDDEKSYYISFKESLDHLTVEPGSTITLNVENSYGTWLVDSENIPDEITVTQNPANGGLTSIEITGVTESSEGVSFVIYPAEAGTDHTFDKTIWVDVYSSTFTLTLNLADTVAASAETVEFTYSNGQVDDTYTADVTYTAGDKTAYVTFDKSTTDEWGFINEIKVTVYDKDGNTVSSVINGNNWLSIYSENKDYASSLDIENPSEKTMKITITFTDFTLSSSDSVTLTYGITADSDTDTVTATIAEDGKSASAEVKNDHLNSNGWFELIPSVTKDGEEVEYTTDGNGWYGFDENGAEITLTKKSGEAFTTLVDGAEFTESSDPVCVVDASVLSGLDISSLKIATSGASSIWWATACTDTEWSNSTTLDWDSDYTNGYSVTITDSDKIAAFKESGIYLAGGITNVYVYYK